MFDLGWSELMLIGVVALIVVGPKDLPNMFRAVGQFTGKARGMAREFSRAMESAADQAGVNEINKTLRAATNPRAFAADKLKSAVTPRPVTPKPVAAATPKSSATDAAAEGDTGPAPGPAPAPASASTLTQATPRPEFKPGGATEALAAQRVALREKLEAESQARAIARREAEALALAAADKVPPAAPAPNTAPDPAP